MTSYRNLVSSIMRIYFYIAQNRLNFLLTVRNLNIRETQFEGPEQRFDKNHNPLRIFLLVFEANLQLISESIIVHLIESLFIGREENAV